MSLDKSWQRLVHKNQTRHLRKPAMRKNGCTKPNNMVQQWAADIYPQFSTRSTISSLSFTDDNLTHTEVVLHCNGKQPKRSSLGESNWAELVIVEEWLCWHYLNPSWILLLSLQLYSSLLFLFWYLIITLIYFKVFSLNTTKKSQWRLPPELEGSLEPFTCLCPRPCFLPGHPCGETLQPHLILPPVTCNL